MKRSVVALVFAAPALLVAITTLLDAGAMPMELRPFARERFEFATEWLTFYGVAWLVVAALWRFTRPIWTSVIALVVAALLFAVILVNDRMAFAHQLGRGSGSPVWFLSYAAVPGTALADALFALAVPAPSARELAESVGAAKRRVQDIVPDGDGVLTTAGPAYAWTVLRFGADGTYDPSFYGAGTIIPSAWAGPPLPVTAEWLLVETTEGLRRLDATGLHTIELPPATRQALRRDEPLAFMRPYRAADGSLWFAYAYDIATGAEHDFALLVHVSTSFEVIAIAYHDVVPTDLVADSYAVNPVSANADGTFTVDVFGSAASARLTFDAQARLLRREATERKRYEVAEERVVESPCAGVSLRYAAALASGDVLALVVTDGEARFGFLGGGVSVPLVRLRGGAIDEGYNGSFSRGVCSR